MIPSVSATCPGAPGERISCHVVSLGRSDNAILHSALSSLGGHGQTSLTRMVSLFNGKLLARNGSVRTSSSSWLGCKKGQKKKSVFPKEKYLQPLWRELGFWFRTGEDSCLRNHVQSDEETVGINESSHLQHVWFSLRKGSLLPLHSHYNSSQIKKVFSIRGGP